MKVKVIDWVLGAVVLAAPGIGFAHGDQPRAKSSDAASKEQQEWGIAGNAHAAKRTVEIRMLDTMRFTPDTINIKKGETVRFVIRNDGQILHEFVIGTKRTLEEHAALMVKFPNMEHQEPYMAHVPPGNKEELVWRFNRAGQFDFACLIAGHYPAMVGAIRVSAK